jgi:hypothetical protein
MAVRYEVAVRTNLTFHTQNPPHRIPFPEPETVVIDFEGRRFVWHALGPNDDGDDRWPVVTTMVADAGDYEGERVAMQRFLSALAFSTSQPVEVLTEGGAGWPLEMDRPVVNALRRGFANHLFRAPGEVVVEQDDRLRLVLGHFREGLNSGSPFFTFLAFWNALDVASEDYDGGMPSWIRATAPDHAHLRPGQEPQPDDWWTYLQNDRRSAVAHAVRDPGRGVDLDPDDPNDRAKLAGDTRMLQSLVEARVRERWGTYAVWMRRGEV